jgi:hypothetical protein
MKISVIVSAFAVCAAGASAQTISGGPVTGAIFDTATHSIRSIMGLPGAAYLGAVPASTWDLAMASPDGKKALAVHGGNLSLIADLSQPDAATNVGGVIAALDRVIWSADSSTAILYSSRSNQLQRVTGLNGTPAIQPAIDLSGAGTISGSALSPDGRSVAYSIAASTAAAGNGSVYLVTDSAPVKVGAVSDPGALTFSNDGASLFVFDRASQKISRLQTSSGAILDSFAASAAGDASATATAPATAAAFRRTPVHSASQPDIRDLAATADGAQLLAIRSDSLCVYDVNHQTPDRCEALDVSPAAIQTIGPGVFVLNYPRTATSPVWLWDGSVGAAFFVPSGRSATNASK